MKKKTRIFRHFITLLNCFALGMPLVVFAYVVGTDALRKYNTSLSVSHNSSSFFTDDIDYSYDLNEFESFDSYTLKTLDNFGYLKYGTALEYQYTPLYQSDDVDNTSVQTQLSTLKNNYIYRMHVEIPREGNSQPSPTVITTGYFTYYDLQVTGSAFVKTVNYGVRTSRLEYRVFYYSNNSTLFYGYYGNSFSVTSIMAPVDYALVQIDILIAFENVSILNLDTDYITFYKVPQNQIPSTVNVVQNDISSFDDWKTYYEGQSYDYIINNGTDTNMILNLDFGEIFFNQDLINHNDSIAVYLFINYMINYIFNITLLLFIPEILMCFINICRNLIYKFVERSDD